MSDNNPENFSINLQAKSRFSAPSCSAEGLLAFVQRWKKDEEKIFIQKYCLTDPNTPPIQGDAAQVDKREAGCCAPSCSESSFRWGVLWHDLMDRVKKWNLLGRKIVDE